MESMTVQCATYRLFFVHGGSLLVRCDNRIFLVPDNHGLFLSTAAECIERLTPGAVVRKIVLRPRAVSRQLADGTVVNPSPLVHALVDHAALLSTTSDERRRAEAVIVDLLIPASSAYELVLPTDLQLLRAAESVFREPVGPHPVSHGAAYAGLSTGRFTQLLTTQTGAYWADWCFVVKMYYAMSLLNQGLAVSDVYHLVNYKTPSSFNTAFSKYFGVTPGASKPHSVCERCGHIKFRRAPHLARGEPQNEVSRWWSTVHAEFFAREIS